MLDKFIKISDLNNYIKRMFDENDLLKKIYIRGEISNFKKHTRGHLYFTLKDDLSRISAVMFYSSAINLNFKPEDGMNVLIEGRVSCYPAGGNYQIYVNKMQPDGLGNLYVEFEKLKQKLAYEGLFNKEHKKNIPKIPKRVGIITAPTGAAIKDILSTIKRRFPLCETILFPSLVQGFNAKDDLVRQIKEADNGYNLDVLIIGRGGGSIEDLWAFNEEEVARAIYNAKTPIVSAVGHEIDYTIADFVADLRAPTPTGAAEMVVPTISELNNIIDSYKIRLNKYMSNKIHKSKLVLDNLTNAYILKNPLSLYELKEQKLDNYIDTLNNCLKNIIDNKKGIFNNLLNSYIIKNPLTLFTKKQEIIINNKNILYKEIKSIILNKEHDYKLLINSLKLVNPLGILDKGYSLVKVNHNLIKDVNMLNLNDIIEIKFSKGNAKAKVLEINDNKGV